MIAREAMAYGRPVVAARVGGLGDLGRGAVLVRPCDVADLRAVLVELLADVERRRSLGIQARAEAHNWATQAAAARLLSVYREALQ